MSPAAGTSVAGGMSPAAGTSVAAGAVSVADALDRAAAEIAAAGCETPRLDAEILLAHALGIARERLLLARETRIPAAAGRAFDDAVCRRAGEREPVAYIVGRRHFRELELVVDRRALIPRPETELLVELAGALPAGARVLDLATGCGAVALALKHERPDLGVSGSDVSRGALALARENGERLGLDVGWIHADLLEGVPDEFDAVVANLPYVAEADRSVLAPEIADHEPPVALFAGGDGLDTIRALLGRDGDRDRCLARLRRVRTLALEVGAGQAGAVAAMVREAGFGDVRRERDLAGIERVVVGEGRP